MHKANTNINTRNSSVYAYVFFLNCQADAGFRLTELEITLYNINKHYINLCINPARFIDNHSFVSHKQLLLAVPPFLHIGQVNKATEAIPTAC